MVPRRSGPRLRRLLREFPAVTILGPRQCGKTTFIRAELPDWSYFDLERPRDAAPFVADAEARFEQVGDSLVLDEAQRVPELFPVLRGVIDRSRSLKGRFVLLGSASPTLVRGISESLAGRTAFLDLTPLRWSEVEPRRGARLEALWFRGGFPDAFLRADDGVRHDWYESYVRTFVERDLNLLGIDASEATMRRLWAMVAHYSGGIWNASQLAASLGISYHTVNRYVDILEQTFLVRKLPPFFANVGKRLVKSPKVYVRDTGLLHYFLGIGSERDLEVHPARGASWEAFVIEEILSATALQSSRTEAYFWRTARGDEVDLVLKSGARIVPIEIKLNSAPSAADAGGVVRCMRDLGASRGYLVYPGSEDYSLGSGVTAVSASRLLKDPARVTQLLGRRAPA